MKKCGLCAEEIKDDKYITVNKGTKNKLVLIAHTKCYTAEQNREIVNKIVGSV